MQTSAQVPPFIVENVVKIINALLLALLTWLTLLLIKAFSRHLRRQFADPKLEPDRRARLMTVENVAVTSLRAIVLSVAGFMLLGMLGYNLAPIIASVGIAGLAISLGAQSLIKDFISGFLIVIENQFGLGDSVEIGPVHGTVEAINLRTVTLRSHSGALNIIPNGEVRIVTNFSRDWVRASVDLNVPFDADVGAVVAALDDALATLNQDETVRAVMLEPPEVSGWHSQSEWGVQVRMTARVKVGEQLRIEKLFREYALESLRKRGVQLAVPGREV
ncbi:MAG: mechanosensitive ion channel family protein [Anaerolineae bacterium]|nr:mechanosensitive ion channel family protein [Anaerolineae bacterium]MCZ7553281.1 mechanosensitive ion channel family protein [Anaerolineales bacterium]